MVGSHRYPESERSERSLPGRRYQKNKHTLTHPLAQLWANHPNLATNFLKVTPNIEHLKVLFKTGLTLFGGCTFSICWRQLLSACQAGHNGIIHNPLKRRQGLEKSSSYLISPEKDVKQGQETMWLLLLLLPSEREHQPAWGKVGIQQHPQRTGKAHREEAPFSLMGSELSADTKLPRCLG